MHIERVARTGHFSMAREHFHDHYELYYLISGERHYFIQDKTYPVRQGELVLVDKHLLHKTISAGTPAHERLLLNFDDAFLREPALAAVFRSGRKVIRFQPRDQSAVGHLLRQMEEEYAGRGMHRRILLQALLDQVLILCARAAAAMPSAESPASPIHPKVTEMIRLLNARFAEPITLSAAAARAGLSVSYASRMFKRGTGFSFVEYLNHIRVREAQRLLRETDLKVIRIAEETGFQNVAHFGRVFKEISGRTPLAYRRQARSES